MCVLCSSPKKSPLQIYRLTIPSQHTHTSLRVGVCGGAGGGAVCFDTQDIREDRISIEDEREDALRSRVVRVELFAQPAHQLRLHVQCIDKIVLTHTHQNLLVNRKVWCVETRVHNPIGFDEGFVSMVQQKQLVNLVLRFHGLFVRLMYSYTLLHTHVATCHSDARGVTMHPFFVWRIRKTVEMVNSILWGPATWQMLFACAWHCQTQNFEHLYRLLFYEVASLLPCEKCRDHFEENIHIVNRTISKRVKSMSSSKGHPTTPKEMFMWLYFLKDRVNRTLSPPQQSLLSLDELTERYVLHGGVVDDVALGDTLVLFAIGARKRNTDELFISMCQTLHHILPIPDDSRAEEGSRVRAKAHPVDVGCCGTSGTHRAWSADVFARPLQDHLGRVNPALSHVCSSPLTCGCV